MKNTLYFGDNLIILRDYIKDESVDLIYLDPPFKSNQDYNVLFEEQNGSRSKAQIKAFEDSWRWDQESAEAFQLTVEAGGNVSKAMQAFRMMVGESDMLAYLSMMAPRLVELKRVLKPTGSIYLHCDPTASHYLKMLMDAVFEKGFRNEIIWRYRRWPTKAKQFQKMHDVILFYSKAKDGSHVFNTLYGYEKLAESTLKAFGTKKQLADFSSGHRKPGTIEEETQGPPLSDVWEIGIIAPIGKERLGYPTQKPEALLERVIRASSNEGDIVLDPFCGCGTAVVVAHRLKRHWIGIDITHLAINLIRHRLRDAFGPEIEKEFEVIGEPVDLSGARTLAEKDPYQFQFWALGLVGARPVEEKKGADKGIDGRIYFHDEKNGKTKQVIIQVKSGHISSAQIRDLRGVLDREQAEIGVFITLEEPSKQMRAESASAGFYESPATKKRYPKLQILTIAEVLSGKKISYPEGWSISPFKKGPGSKIPPSFLF